MRTTPQLLDVVGVLARATTPVHGWEIARRAGQEPHTVYRILERLRTREWVTCEWAPDTGEPGPRRRLYQLTDGGTNSATELLKDRRTRHGAAGAEPGAELD